MIMTEKQILEGNILIARFLGWELSEKARKWNVGEFYPYGYVSANPNYLHFDKSWDWLIPVLEKIEDIDYVADIEIHSQITNIYADKTFTHFNKGDWSPIATWECIVDFIKWHNTINDK